MSPSSSATRCGRAVRRRVLPRRRPAHGRLPRRSTRSARRGVRRGRGPRRPRRRPARGRRPRAGRRDDARPLHVRDALPRSRAAAFLTLGAVRGDAERGCSSPSSSARSGGPCSSSAALAAAAGLRIVHHHRLRGHADDHVGDRRLDAGPGRRAGRSARRGDGRDRRPSRCSARSSSRRRPTDRGLHGLRRRAGRRAARPDRGGARLGDAEERRRRWPRGLLPFEALYQDGLNALIATRPATEAPSSARSAAPRQPGRFSGPGRWSTWPHRRRALAACEEGSVTAVTNDAA